MKSAAETTFHIETLGCPKNRVDSRRMRTSLLQLGYKEAPKPEAADIFLINSCSFIREAQEETIHTVFDTLKIRNKRSPDMKVGLVGCFVERFSDAVKADIPELDFTIGTRRYHEVGGLISERFGIAPVAHAAELSENVVRAEDADTQKSFSWFRIAQGCNRKCAFCIIPKIRGGLATYDLENIEKQFQEDANLRAAIGGPQMREAILVSQDTISQGVDAIADIVDFLSQKEQIRWIRLQYLFPDRRILELLKLWQKFPKLVSYLDIPFQHVSPNMLTAMKRPSDVGLFREIIAMARDVRPDLELRTSYIVGFPGETMADYEMLENFTRENRIDKLALFRYSHEVGTSAGDTLAETVADEEKYRRINALRELHLESRKKYATGLIGQRETMIVDEVNRLEITLRRAQDAPESDEIVTVPVTKTTPAVAVADMPTVELKAYTEYSFFGEIV